jgi:hypothetical protein
MVEFEEMRPGSRNFEPFFLKVAKTNYGKNGRLQSIFVDCVIYQY